MGLMTLKSAMIIPLKGSHEGAPDFCKIVGGRSGDHLEIRKWIY